MRVIFLKSGKQIRRNKYRTGLYSGKRFHAGKRPTPILHVSTILRLYSGHCPLNDRRWNVLNFQGILRPNHYSMHIAKLTESLNLIFIQLNYMLLLLVVVLID